MEKPVCKICQKKHYSYEPCVQVNLSPSESAILASLSEKRAKAEHGHTGARTKKPFDRTAYQREYMRKRRAGQKTKDKT